MSSTNILLNNDETIFSLLNSNSANISVFIDDDKLKTWEDVRLLSSHVYTKIHQSTNPTITDAILATDNAMIILASIIACWCSNIVPNFPNGIESENIASIINPKSIIITENSLLQKFSNNVNAEIISVSLNENTIFSSTDFESKVKHIASNKKLELMQKIVQFTTGSTGTPKKITKEIKEFYIESKIITETVLNRNKINNNLVVSTVPCFHAYGFIFRFLIPILNKITSYSKVIGYPEQFETIFKKHNNLILVSSPGFLKRMKGISADNKVKLLISAGGKIDGNTINTIKDNFSIPVIDILGSTETGVLGYREANKITDEFKSVKENHIYVLSNSKEKLLLQGQGLLAIESDYIPNNLKKHLVDLEEKIHNVYITSDIVDITSYQSFKFIGRQGRVIKIEDNRISLDNIEFALTELPYIHEAVVIPITLKDRETVAACITLSDIGLQIYNKTSKGKFIINIRNELKKIKKIAIPKKVLIISSIPQTPNGKSNYQKVKEMILNEISPTNQS